jgi:hypothetical protein
MTDYLHTSVQERGSPEGHRENSNAINHLLDEVTKIDDRLVIVEDILTFLILTEREFAILNGQTGTHLSGAVIDNWTASGTAHIDSLIATDAAAGTITVGATGLYEIKAEMIWTGTANNQDYDFIAHANAGPGLRAGYSYQPSQAADATVVLVAYRSFTAGDVVTFSMNGATATYEQGQISVMLKTPELIAQ